MPQLLWDSSALSKRYVPELGSDTVDALMDAVPLVTNLTTYLCFAETCASLRRKLNQGTIDLTAFSAPRSALEIEVLLDPNFGLMTVTDADVLSGVALTDQHNINSSDAAVLAALLKYVRSQPPTAAACVFVVADRRLLWAAQ